MKPFTFLCFLIISTLIQAQQFSEVILDPFGIDLDHAYINDMQFVDFTGDGAFDIVYNDTYIGDPLILINRGSQLTPDFSNVEIKDFYHLEIGDSLVGSAEETNPNSRFIDLDFDGDIDHIFQVGGLPSKSGEFLFETNIVELAPSGPPRLLYSFAIEHPGSDIGLPNTPSDALEHFEFVDLDGDGDQDIFSIRLLEHDNIVEFAFYESLFSTSVNMFNGVALTNPFGLEGISNDIYAGGVPTFFDLERDGDMDLLISTILGDWAFYENIGDANNPFFGARQLNPFGLTNIGRLGNPYLIDMNNDGWKDLIVGAGDHVYYFPFNELSNTSVVAQSQHANIWPNPVRENLTISCIKHDIQSCAIYNDLGQIEQEIKSLEENEISLSTIGLNPGMYVLHVERSDGQFERHKFIKL